MSLSLKDTNILKGVALMMLLWHHLFYTRNGMYTELCVGKYELAEMFARICKLCVAIFVMLSGYGLTVQAEKNGGINSIGSFYRHRFSKLFVNYWFIWLLFVPVGVLVFDRGFEEVYQTNIIPKFVADVLGLAFAFNFYGYNATWWFMSCIIVLYLGYPFLYKAVKNYPIYTLLGSVSVAIAVPAVGQHFGFLNSTILMYLPAFVLGILMKICPIYIEREKEKHSRVLQAVLLLLFLTLWVEHLYVKANIVFDAVITLSMIMLYKSVELPTFVEKTLEFLGKHSMNIFLFHTFIFSHWLKDFIYSPKNPLLIFLLLLALCLIISVAIEWLKKIIKIDSLIK